MIIPPVLPGLLFVDSFIRTDVTTYGGFPVYDDRDTFYPALHNFTQDGQNVRFLADIVYNDDGEIEASVHVYKPVDACHGRGAASWRVRGFRLTMGLLELRSSG